MPHLTDSEKITVCALVLADRPLPQQLQERLFPGEPKSPAPSKPAKATLAQVSTESKSAVTIQEAAQRLSLSVSQLRKLVRQERIKRVSGIRRVIISTAELERFANSSE